MKNPKALSGTGMMMEKKFIDKTLADVAATLGQLSKGGAFMFAYCENGDSDSINLSWGGKGADIVYMCEQLKAAVIERQNDL